jgi:hypothetical protein
MDPGTAMPILAPAGDALLKPGCEIGDSRDSSRVVVAWRRYAIARQLRGAGAHKDTLNLGPSKIETDPQPVLTGWAGHAPLSGLAWRAGKVSAFRPSLVPPPALGRVAS